MPKYSIIVPVFMRPGEVDEFLTSMKGQTFRDFEVIMVDGSPDKVLHPIIKKHTNSLPLVYQHVPRLGASESRNLGVEKAGGTYYVFIDSDCIVPPSYLATIDASIQLDPIDGFGGPDMAHESFSPVLKAINYAMTSMLTTGGIRGKKKHVGKFQLRGFNMGIRKEAFLSVGGFSGMQVGEDIDLSMRLHKAGYTTALIVDAGVYHKRKSNFKKFARQLFMHGKGRIDLFVRHKDALKIVHLLPSAFVGYLLFTLLLPVISFFLFYIALIPIILYILALLADSTVQTKSIKTGFLSTIASLILLCTYGTGLLYNFIKRFVFRKNSDSVKSIILKQ